MRDVTAREDPDAQNQGILTSQMGPWALVPVWVLGHDLSAGELRAYIAIRSFCNADRACFPSAKKIAERAGLSIGTVHNAIPKLRAKKLIATKRNHRGDGSFSGFTYRLTDLDPKRWNVSLRDPEPEQVDKPGPMPSSPCSEEGPMPSSPSDEPTLHQTMNPPFTGPLTHEETTEHTYEETSSGCASSSPRAEALQPRSGEDDLGEDEAHVFNDHVPPRQRQPSDGPTKPHRPKGPTRREREEQAAYTLIFEHSNADEQEAQILVAALYEKGIRNVGSYLRAVVEQDGEDKIGDLVEDAWVDYWDQVGR